MQKAADWLLQWDTAQHCVVQANSSDANTAKPLDQRAAEFNEVKDQAEEEPLKRQAILVSTRVIPVDITDQQCCGGGMRGKPVSHKQLDQILINLKQPQLLYFKEISTIF